MASRSEGIMPVTESDVNQNLPLHEDSSPEAVQISNLDDNGESIRPQAAMSVGRDADFYKMDHKKRGQAIIFVHDQFDDINLQPRTCAKHDTAITRHAFEHLSFEVKEHWNLKKRDFLATLHQVSSENHHNSDCLVVVFMSHGNVNNNKEFLCTQDFKVDTEELWKNFTADKCPSLAGKPKLFFIQACRGDNIDKGVKMKHTKALNVQVDCMHRKEDYVIPLHADMLMMWASYPGVFTAFCYIRFRTSCIHNMP
ncbi:hypothetical protein O3P69_008953 [Scylla paramamosain]|uniref:Caspase family p20 domain-containing protein n=1 Tax=Scylla paramamosain TaxID=85552 RepID=A0AAW0TQ74_SCYPA